MLTRLLLAAAAPLEEVPAEGGVSVLDWGIVVVLIAVAIFVVCRSSRRN